MCAVAAAFITFESVASRIHLLIFFRRLPHVQPAAGGEAAGLVSSKTIAFAPTLSHWLENEGTKVLVGKHR